MLRKLLLVVFLINGILLGCSLGADDTPVTSSENPVIITSSSTQEPTTEKTTERPTTAASTAKPTTETTTTPEPTKTPTTSTAPTPTPKPPTVKAWPENVGNWNVSDDQTGVTCILMKAALQLVVPFKVDTNTTNVTNLDVPVSGVTVTGTCGEVAQMITLTWEAAKESAELNVLKLTFGINDKTNTSKISPNKFALENVTGRVFVPTSNVTLQAVDVKLESLDTYQTGTNKSFKCESEETLKNKDGAGVQLKVAHAQVEAFRQVPDGKFGPAVECELDGAVADIVPIAVGASLAGLVVIVLIAYLIGRRRSRARGYQSV